MFGDIVQGSFMDSYRNLSYKGSPTQITNMWCSRGQSSFFMKISHQLSPYLKGSHGIFNLKFFLAQQTLPGLLRNRPKRFRELFRFHQAIRLLSQRLCGHTNFASIFTKTFAKPFILGPSRIVP